MLNPHTDPRRYLRWRSLLALLPLLALMPVMGPGCDSKQPAVAIVSPTGQPLATLVVEIARTRTQREVGLMFRKHLGADRGMLFVFAQPAPQAFWMHNTLIPLDMLFVGADRRILGIVANATPMSDRSLSVQGNALYVLEVNGGFCARHGIAAGDRLRFVNFTPSAAD
ncbi:MAG TPA: DUF192 domain-containing protein [Candidatus Binataceae bacterium]|nr:DUF192 domain-containing protein [Candidatus Binataceae bacterium]